MNPLEPAMKKSIHWDAWDALQPIITRFFVF